MQVQAHAPAAPVSILRHRLIAALDDALDLAQEQDWVWGERDCALWAANVIRGPLSYDPAERFRHRYTTARGYLRVLRREGYRSLGEALAAVARERGWRTIAPKDARRGDLGFAPIAGNAAVGACLLNYTATHWVGFRTRGHAYMPAGTITIAWSIA